MKRHWSFVVCDPRYAYSATTILLVLSLLCAAHFHRADYFSRAGNFIIGVGVWISMRYTLREGINKHKDAAMASPTYPGTNQLNPGYFNNIAFSIGDAQLQLHGFALVVIGSIVASVGDLALMAICPGHFQ
jgi:hypothetical protein